MATYGFKCKCGVFTSIVSKIMIEGEVLSVCPVCKEEIKKVFTADGQSGNVSGGTPIHYAR